MTALVRNLNALWIVIYASIITTAFGLQIFLNEEPCPLCYLQRISMISVAFGALLNLYYGVRLSHYGLILLAATFGGAEAIRQILLHVCPDFPQFGEPFWGLSLYTWSFLTFVCSILMTSVLLFLYRPEQQMPRPLNLFQRFACWWLLLVASGNVISTLIDCGLGACGD